MSTMLERRLKEEDKVGEDEDRMKEEDGGVRGWRGGGQGWMMEERRMEEYEVGEEVAFILEGGGVGGMGNHQ